jgi:hypothetical protein
VLRKRRVFPHKHNIGAVSARTTVPSPVATSPDPDDPDEATLKDLQNVDGDPGTAIKVLTWPLSTAHGKPDSSLSWFEKRR